MLTVTCLLASSLSVGCIGKYTGGGAIESAAGAPHRATFGCVVEGTVPDENGTERAPKPTKRWGWISLMNLNQCHREFVLGCGGRQGLCGCFRSFRCGHPV